MTKNLTTKPRNSNPELAASQTLVDCGGVIVASWTIDRKSLCQKEAHGCGCGCSTPPR